jgi:cytochrome P450
MNAALHGVNRLPSTALLGHLRDFREHRIELLLRVAREQPEIAHLNLGVFDLMVVTSPAIAREILVDQADAFHKSLGISLFAGPMLGNGLIRSEGAFHKRQRRMLAPAFMPKRIGRYAEVMAARAAQGAERMIAQGNVDLAEETMRVTLEIVGKTLFDAEVGGEASDVYDALTQAMECMMRSLTASIPIPPPIPTPTNLAGLRAVRSLDRVIYRLIRERRASGQQREDVLSTLLEVEEDGTRLDDRQVRDEAMNLFLAGHETTANALAWALWRLALHPDVRRRAVEEVDRALGGRLPGAEDLRALPFTLQVIKEAMRLHPPVYMTGRRNRRPVELGGHRFESKHTFMINIIGMHRRPDVFGTPEAFDPDRWEPGRETSEMRHAFIPFGGGPRICIGNHFALMEAQLILATWLQRIDFALVDPKRPMDAEPLITLRPKDGVPARVKAR